MTRTKDQIDKVLSDGNWLGETDGNKLNIYENFLDVRFPDDYRYFFLNYGSGVKNGIEIAGFHPSPISDMNIVARTIVELRDYCFYPDHFIFLSDLGDGTQIAFHKETWEIFELIRKPPDKVFDNKLFMDFYGFLHFYFL